MIMMSHVTVTKYDQDESYITITEHCHEESCSVTEYYNGELYITIAEHNNSEA